MIHKYPIFISALTNILYVRCNISGGQHQLLPIRHCSSVYRNNAAVVAIEDEPTFTPLATAFSITTASCYNYDRTRLYLHHHHSCHRTTMFGHVQFYCLQLFQFTNPKSSLVRAHVYRSCVHIPLNRCREPKEGGILDLSMLFNVERL